MLLLLCYQQCQETTKGEKPRSQEKQKPRNGEAEITKVTKATKQKATRAKNPKDTKTPKPKIRTDPDCTKKMPLHNKDKVPSKQFNVQHAHLGSLPHDSHAETCQASAPATPMPLLAKLISLTDVVTIKASARAWSNTRITMKRTDMEVS